MRQIRRLVSCITLLLAGAGAAAAGDSSYLNAIGYSDDGKIFAFEEYGTQDGSGFAYSNIFFLDTESDAFLPGTPIKVMIEEEESMAKIRALSLAKAKPLIEKYNLADNPGILVAYNTISEVDSDPFKLRYYPFISSPPRSQTETLVLTEKEFPAPEKCLNMVGVYSGFTLTQTERGGEPTNIVIHDDKTVPASRYCPNGYRLGAVISHELGRGPQIAMIQVSNFGFEGNDQRWIAVPVQPRD